MLYTRKMLNHDYSQEAYNYVRENMTNDEIAEDLRQCLSEYELEDEEIFDDYLKRLLDSVENEREAAV